MIRSPAQSHARLQITRHRNDRWFREPSEDRTNSVHIWLLRISPDRYRIPSSMGAIKRQNDRRQSYGD